ncbi:uncharacterized protein LACBIDRAFT_295169 [Laccaria bicolor S238N-H82]|uniref:Predicted protein n=1 Tax=Laccaria bicolor (strain S238N-H82 / ATCC MYA-4686) TaxID=486041 RepID=B0DNV8_LACBS|nr:uncharacterized protein LACBIDRAFT_295169 [Laccaria bicolor S238N-H82]EDR03720.1 predicted protein [Laccaria bicolor S238N-H82]|eukprot:XP_001885573.1 predicted protein [Laccaria bicolor S238N-H82]
MSDRLIFDILLTSGGAIRDADLIYPPTDPQGLRRLLDAIGSSHYDALKKNCLVYFLLKWHQDGREEKLAKFTMLADAYWYLDSGINVPRAVTLLSDARLNRDYASKILQAISLTPDPAPLIRRYVRTAKPSLTEPNDLIMYLVALAESSLLEAWTFQRTFHDKDFMRPKLFEKLLEWVVTPEPRPAALTMLISLPLSPFEEGLLHSYAQDPPASIKSSDAAILQDLVCVRLIQAGRHAEAIKLDRQFSSSPATSQNLKATQDRKKMVQDLYAALTSAERAQLDAELNSAANPTPAAAPPRPVNGSANVAADVTMSQSWEDVRPSDALNQSTSSIQNIRAPDLNGSISKQSGAPRFGGPISMNNARLPQPVTAAPLLPITSTTITNPASGSSSIPTPRKSLGFPATTPLTSSLLGPSSSSSKQPRQSLNSLSGVGSRMLGTFGGTSSPASGLKFPPLGSSTNGKGIPQPINFTPSGSRQNAFYQPPQPAKTNGVKRPFDGLSVSPERPNPLVSMDQQSENEVMDLDESSEKEPHTNGTANGHTTRPDDENMVLEFSVFGNTRGTKTSAPEKLAASQSHKNELSLSASQRKRLPPGAFLDDDDTHEDEDDEPPQQEQEEQRQQPSNQKRKSARTSKRTTDAPTKPTRTTKRQTKTREPVGSFPGALSDNDNEEEEGEEQDHVMPLPGPPVSTAPLGKAAARPTRKPRSSASMSDVGDGETGDGVKTRRRSSRLTTTGSVGDLEAPVKTRKGTSRSGTAAATQNQLIVIYAVAIDEDIVDMHPWGDHKLIGCSLFDERVIVKEGHASRIINSEEWVENGDVCMWPEGGMFMIMRQKGWHTPHRNACIPKQNDCVVSDDDLHQESYQNAGGYEVPNRYDITKLDNYPIEVY